MSDYLHIKEYTGEGFYQHLFLKVGLISKVTISGKQNTLTIHHSGNAYPLKTSKIPDILNDLKKLGVIPDGFDISQLKLNEEELREKLKEVENQNKK